MPIRELNPEEIDAVWPRLQHLVGDDVSRLERIKKMLEETGPYCLYLESDDGHAAGLAVVDYYRSAWVFNDHIAAIREFLADDGARDGLLAAIEERARDMTATHLSRFTTADDPLVPMWHAAGFVEFMAAYRREIDVEGDALPVEANDDITIREVTDLEADWPKLWPLFEKLNQHHAALTSRSLTSGREENARSELVEELTSGESLVMLAEAEGRAVATSSARLGETHADGSRTGFRSRLYVEEPYRRRGLAARFEARALPWLREHGVSHVERWIVAGNERPQQIWSAHGYRPERLILRKALG